jgi:hypothetical protein
VCVGLDCAWCRYWQREHDFITKARLTLENQADTEKDLERKWRIMQGIEAADALLADFQKTIRLHEFREHPQAIGCGLSRQAD